MISKFTYIAVWIMTIVLTLVYIAGCIFAYNPVWIYSVLIQWLIMYETKDLYEKF